MQTKAKTNHRGNGVTRNEILEIVRVMPGLTAKEIAELMPHCNASTIASVIHGLKISGALKVTGKKEIMRSNGWPTKAETFELSNDPTPNVVRMKQREPTEAGLHMQVKELKAKVAELEGWQRDAIARYPDLAVDPVVLTARKLVAAEVRAGGDNNLADHVLAGHKDDTLMVRVAVKALEAAQ